MRRNAKTALFVSVAAIALAGWFWLRARLVSERATLDLAQLRQQRDMLATPETKERVRPNQGTPSVEGTPESAGQTPPKITKSSSYVAMQKDPALQKRFLATRRASIPSAYGALFRTLHLTPEKAVSLAALIAGRNDQAFDTALAVPRVLKSMASFDDTSFTHLTVDLYDAGDLAAPSLPESLPRTADNQAAAALLQHNEESFRSSVSALIGKEGLQQLQAFERMLPVQAAVEQLAGVLALSDEPLATGQADRLLPILADATPSYRAGGDAIVRLIEWDNALQRAKEVLSPAQLRAVHLAVEASQAQQAMAKQFDLLENVGVGGAGK